MKKILLVICLLVGNVFAAVPCTSQIFISQYTDVNLNPLVNRGTVFDEYDENNSFIQNLGNLRTNSTGHVTYYPPNCGCFDISGRMKGLGDGYWVVSKYNWDTGMYEVQEINTSYVCITNDDQYQFSVWTSYWQPI